MRAVVALALLVLAAALALGACGEETPEADSPAPSRTTLHVRVAGMVQSLGIT